MITLRRNLNRKMTIPEMDNNLTYLESLGLSQSYISVITLSGNDLIFTGTGSAFSGTISLPISGSGSVDYISGITLSGENLVFSGTGSAFSGTISLSGISGGTQSYISGITLSSNDLVFTGTGSAFSGTISLPEKAYTNYFDFSSSYITNIVDADTWYKLNSNTTTSFSRNGLSTSNNRVTNTGSKRVFKIEGIVSLTAGNNQEIHASFFRGKLNEGPSLHPCSEQSTITGTGNRTNAIPFHCLIELDNGDFIEVWVKNKAGTNDITLSNVNVIITEL